MVYINRNTIQRQIILDAVKSLNTHVSAEQVYQIVAQSHPSISKATVYRNLSQMAQSGLLLNIGVIDGATHYDHNTHEHHHLICDDCKNIFDVEHDVFNIPAHTVNTKDFDINGYNITLNGLCRQCKEHNVS